MAAPTRRRHAVRKRRAWTYTPDPAPGFSSLFANRDERKRFVQYWWRDNLGNAFDLLIHFGLKTLPFDTCSYIGAKLGRYAFPRWHKTAVRRATDTLTTLRPEMPPEERQKWLERNWENQGRLMAEYALINRIIRHPNRITVHGIEHIRQAAGEGAAIFVGLHLGNWELTASVFAKEGVRPYTVYAPPRQRGRRWIANNVRRKGGLRLLPPGRHAVRPMLKALYQKEPCIVFCDEAVGGIIRGPLFGRPPHFQGNLAVAVRLARITGAKIYPFYVLRKDSSMRFSYTALPPIEFESIARPSNQELLLDIQKLNDKIEPVIQDNLEQWYFLDSAL